MSDTFGSDKESVFSPGDVVQLRSGGPFGTVLDATSHAHRASVTVGYFNNVDGTFTKFTIDERCLKFVGNSPRVVDDVLARSSFRGQA